MARRKKRISKRPHKSPQTISRNLSSRLLAFLNLQNRMVSTAWIHDNFAKSLSNRKTIREALHALERDGKIRRDRKKWGRVVKGPLVRAILSMTAKGFGFAVLEGNVAKKQKDIFIPPSGLKGASHGDVVMVQVVDTSRRPEGRIVEVVKRGFKRLCGVYVDGGNLGYVTPDNEKIPYTVQIRSNDAKGAENGDAVVVEIIDYGEHQRMVTGKVLEILGSPDTVSVQLRMAMEQFSLDRSFSRKVLRAAEGLEELTEVSGRRKDLRYVRHVTIDGETAKDFDDGICVQKTKKGFRLFVSIADVSHYVRPGSVIDREAYERGTSVYLPGTVLPMLPERLSNDLCSLVPDRDRPAFTAILEFDRQGKRIGAKYVKSLIHSYQRFTYDTVNALVFLNREEERKKYKSLLPMLTKAKELDRLLRQQRKERGAPGFNMREAAITLAGDRIDSIGQAERNQAHLLIESFMLAANEAVAETLTDAGVLFRIHEKPDSLKIDAFKETAAAMGMQLHEKRSAGKGKQEVTPSWFAGVLANVQGDDAEYVINNLLLRTMQRARYSPENLGHFGLAADFYLHFTSPIRRYPDLVAHRVLENFLIGNKDSRERRVLPGKTSLEAAALHLSKRERVAVEVERNAHARLAALFLKDRITEKFSGVISGVTSFGIFVELAEYFISGAVPIRDLGDDYFQFDATGHKFIGERSGVQYQLGDKVRVELVQVDMLTKRITFSLVEDL